jgi:hypothetical protein
MKKPLITSIVMAAWGVLHVARPADTSHSTPETSCP